MTERKAIDLIQHEGREKRDWRRNQEAGASSAQIDLEGREPDPAFAVQIAEELQNRLELLADDELRAIAVRKMEGCTNQEIAAAMGCSLVTVERRLRLIRREWAGTMPEA